MTNFCNNVAVTTDDSSGFALMFTKLLGKYSALSAPPGVEGLLLIASISKRCCNTVAAFLQDSSLVSLFSCCTLLSLNV